MNTTTYTRANREGLVEDHGTDGLLIDFLLRMAAYDMQAASISVDWHERSFTVTQKPHQGPERIITGHWPLEDEIVRWIDSEQARTADFEVYGMDSRTVEELLSLCGGGLDGRPRQLHPAALEVPAGVLRPVREAVLQALGSAADGITKSINRATAFENPEPAAIDTALADWVKAERFASILDQLGWKHNTPEQIAEYVERSDLDHLSEVLRDELELSRELLEAERAGYKTLAGTDAQRAEALRDREALAAWIPEALDLIGAGAVA